MTSDRHREILPLTGLRTGAAWWVVAFHFGRDHVGVPVLHQILAAGHVAVDLFFVLSGFVLAYRYRPEDVATSRGRSAFWLRRFARVYPLYVASLMLGFYSEWPGSLHALASEAGAVRLAAQLALLNAFSHKWMFRLNWAAWSLSVEAFFYVLFPWILPWVIRRNPRRLIVWCALAALVAPALYAALDPDHLGRPLALGDEVLWSWYLKFFPLQRLPMFIAGAAAAQLAGMVKVPRYATALATVALLAIVWTRQLPYAFLQAGALLIVFVVLVVALAAECDGDPVARVLGSAPFVMLGRASYATYIFHVPLFLAWARFDAGLWTHGSHVVGYMLVLLLLSLVAHRCVEEPARRQVVRWNATVNQKRTRACAA